MKFATFDQELIAREYWATIVKSHEIGTSREHRNVLYRHAFFVVCRNVTQLSLKSIGRILDKDHATVLHAIRQHDTNLRFCAQYQNIYTEMHECLNDIIETNAERVYNIVKQKAQEVNSDAFTDHMVIMYKQKIKNQEEKTEQVKKELAIVAEHNKKLQKRNEELNAECLRLKELL
jgi:hypothetical protein|tara:strand:+ start:544 stop:1071 length:528 start_codon:yes stop_codon:yes gene_type:complete